MPYLIRRKEPVDAEVRQVLLEQNRRAMTLLERWQDDPRAHVHQARQAFKRVRALLRLIRPGVRYVYRVENRIYRDLGRDLAYARDNEAVVEALGLLESSISGPLAQESLQMLRRGLERRAERQRDCGIHDLAGRIETSIEALEDAEKRFQDLPLGDLRRRDLRRGVEHTIERCRRGFARVSEGRNPDDFHAWRKAAKCAYHQTRLMLELMPRWSVRSGPEFAQLGDVLGHYHDLVILDALLRRQVDELGIDVHLRSMRNAVRKAMGEFAAEALTSGGRLFARPGSDAPPGVDAAAGT